MGTESRQQHDIENNCGVALSPRAGTVSAKVDRSSTTGPTDTESRIEMPKPRRSQRILEEYREQTLKSSEECAKLETLLVTRTEELDFFKHCYSKSRSAEKKLQKEVDQLDKENKRLINKNKDDEKDLVFLDRVWADIIDKYLRPHAKKTGRNRRHGASLKSIQSLEVSSKMQWKCTRCGVVCGSLKMMFEDCKSSYKLCRARCLPGS